MKIAIVGTGYVGLSNAMLLAKNNQVIAFDIAKERVDLLNKGVSPIVDNDISKCLSDGALNFSATFDKRKAYSGADFIIIAAPTNFDPNTNNFDTSPIESILRDIKTINPSAVAIIKSTVPIGFTRQIKKSLDFENVIFSPEFLREGLALHDNLYPSRIIVGEKSERAFRFANLLKQGALKAEIDVLLTGSDEAEAIKLLANTYLAMRVAYINEIDNFALSNNLNTKDIILGISLDPRIGNYYNNPSFGYGGYCLPKDTKQLFSNYNAVPQNLIHATILSNDTRKNFIASAIAKLNPKMVGVYRLVMKSGSDNFRESSIQSIVSQLSDLGINIQIYEPNWGSPQFATFNVIKDFSEFKTTSDVVICNRMYDELLDIKSKVFTRDVFGVD
jgi:UDPglucose 6-dehydrogenase